MGFLGCFFVAKSGGKGKVKRWFYMNNNGYFPAPYFPLFSIDGAAKKLIITKNDVLMLRKPV
jgi:hypothetical protein